MGSTQGDCGQLFKFDAGELLCEDVESREVPLKLLPTEFGGKKRFFRFFDNRSTSVGWSLMANDKGVFIRLRILELIRCLLPDGGIGKSIESCGSQAGSATGISPGRFSPPAK